MNKEKVICSCCKKETTQGMMRQSKKNPKDTAVFCVDCLNAGYEPYEALVNMCASENVFYEELPEELQDMTKRSLEFYNAKIVNFNADVKYAMDKLGSQPQTEVFDTEVLVPGYTIKCRINTNTLGGVIYSADDTKVEILTLEPYNPSQSQLVPVTVQQIQSGESDIMLVMPSVPENVCLDDDNHFLIKKSNFAHYEKQLMEMNIIREVHAIQQLVDNVSADQNCEEQPDTPEPETELRICDKIAKRQGWTVNPDKAVTDSILKGLQSNREKYGAMYCPCEITHTNDTICPCNTFRKEVKEGVCHCGLYIKPSVDELGREYKLQKGDVVSFTGAHFNLPTAYLNTCGVIEDFTKYGVVVRFNATAIPADEYIGSHLTLPPQDLVKLNKNKTVGFIPVVK